MKFIKENKKVLIICISSIIITIIIALSLTYNPEKKFEYTEDSNYLHNYKVNEIIPVYVNENQMAKKYLADYANLMINNPKNAYEYLENDFREINYPDYDSFKAYLDDTLSLKFMKLKVDKYKITYQDGLKVFIVIDGEGNRFEFIEKSIMNYQVKIQ